MDQLGYVSTWLWINLLMDQLGYGSTWLCINLVMYQLGYGLTWLWINLVIEVWFQTRTKFGTSVGTLVVPRFILPNFGNFSKKSSGSKFESFTKVPRLEKVEKHWAKSYNTYRLSLIHI